MITLGCPFIGRSIIIHKLWLENLKRLDIPRKEFKLLFVDLAKNDTITALYHKCIDEIGKDFAEVEYVKDPEKKEPVTDKDPFVKEEVYLARRRSIAETMGIINKHRVGNLLLWEDDTIVPDNAYRVLAEKVPDVTMATGVQYARNEDWDGGQAILCWDMTNTGLKNKVYAQEKQSGWEHVIAASTGFAMIKGDFLDTHDYHSEGNLGQDIVLCKHIFEVGGKVALCWDLKFAHIGIANNGRFRVFRSPLCQTEVIDDCGTRF